MHTSAKAWVAFMDNTAAIHYGGVLYRSNGTLTADSEANLTFNHNSVGATGSGGAIRL